VITPATQATLPIVLVNGEVHSAEAPAISARDRGFTLADGLFETMCVRGGVIFRLDRHLSRLSGGLRVMQIPEPPQLRAWLQQAVARVGPVDASVRLTVTRGSSAGGLAAPADPRPTTTITVGPMPRVDPDVYRSGLRAIVASGRRNAMSMSAGLKTLAYTDSVLAWLEAHRAGADEALLLDTDGHCSEAAASNLFVYSRGTLLTPPVTCAALPGITREAILELSASLNIKAHERPVSVDELARADEVFLTSSLRGVAPVREIDGRPVGAGVVGMVTTRLATAYDGLVNEECGTA
jgi:branched-chain amino acid aminotransferase